MDYSPELQAWIVENRDAEISELIKITETLDKKNGYTSTKLKIAGNKIELRLPILKKGNRPKNISMKRWKSQLTKSIVRIIFERIAAYNPHFIKELKIVHIFYPIQFALLDKQIVEPIYGLYKNNEIYVYMHPGEGQILEEELILTLYHEVGHHVYRKFIWNNELPNTEELDEAFADAFYYLIKGDNQNAYLILRKGFKKDGDNKYVKKIVELILDRFRKLFYKTNKDGLISQISSAPLRKMLRTVGKFLYNNQEHLLLKENLDALVVPPQEKNNNNNDDDDKITQGEKNPPALENIHSNSTEVNDKSKDI